MGQRPLGLGKHPEHREARGRDPQAELSDLPLRFGERSHYGANNSPLARAKPALISPPSTASVLGPAVLGPRGRPSEL